MHKRPQGFNHLLVLKMNDVAPVSRNLAPCNKRMMVSSVFVNAGIGIRLVLEEDREGGVSGGLPGTGFAA